MASPAAFESVSTWRQPPPQPLSAPRTEVLERLAARIDALSSGRLRVAVDGRTGAGKTSFAGELAASLRSLGRATLRAGLDDFKRPWRDRHLYDRTSGEGYYRNAQDQDAAVDLLLRPAGPDGSGRVTLCSIDPLTQQDHSHVTVEAPPDAVLVVDGVFALRPAYAPYWDLTIWIEVDAAESLRRGVDRDQDREGREQATRLHAERYAESERIYIAEVDPVATADVVVDNTDLSHPTILP